MSRIHSLAAALATLGILGSSIYYSRHAFSGWEAKSSLHDLIDALSPDLVSSDSSAIKTYLQPPGTCHNNLMVLPLAVVSPCSTSDVQAVVKVARRHKLHIICISAQSSLEGHTLPLRKRTILMTFQNMSSIISLNVDDADAVVQPGLAWVDLNSKLREMNAPLFFPVDPSLTAQFGGMIASGGSGTGAVRYGAIGAHILNCTVVLPDASVIKTRSRARKSAMGWDATKLFIGSEGTLGSTVRLSPILPTLVAISSFETVHDAVSAVVKILQSSVQVHCLELLDDQAMRAVNISRSERRIDLFPEKPSLWFKFSGSSANIIQQNITVTKKILDSFHGQFVAQSQNEADSEFLWNDRKQIFWSQQKLVPGCQVYITDNCVPISKMPELVQRTKNLIDSSGFIAPLIAHAGDGNFHAAILVSPKQNMSDAISVANKITEIAIELDGTASGEHGVGISKKKFLETELGHDTVRLMSMIKSTIDPENMLNPGKLLPDM